MTGLSIILICATIICGIIVQKSNQIINEESKRSLEEISEQSAMKVNQSIQYNMTTLESINSNLALLEENEQLKAEYLHDVNNRPPFDGIGITDLNGIIYYDNGDIADLSNIEIIQNTIAGESKNICQRIKSDNVSRAGYLYATPYLKNGVIAGATVGWLQTDTLQEILETSTFSGEGFSHIINIDGDFIIRSHNKNAVLNEENFFIAIQERGSFSDENSLEIMHNDMIQGKSGFIRFSIDNNIEEALAYTPLTNSDWYLLSVVPVGIYAKRINYFTNLAILLSAIIFILFLILICFIVFNNHRNSIKLEKLAYEDPITNGYTNQRFEIELLEHLQNFEPFSLVSMDIRRFKLINDVFGSQHGDKMLKHVHDCIKQSLKGGESTARIASDTFHILYESTDRKDIENRLYELSKEVNRFNERIETPYYLTFDYGVYVVNEADTNIVMIRDRANTARKSSKQVEDNSHCHCIFYNDSDRLKMLRDQEMENVEDRALHQKEFIVYLQPKIDLATSKIVGAEALSRWQDPKKGLIPPNDFIPLFERNGFIRKLDLYVFEEVCSLLQRWIQSGIKPVPISINLSRYYLTNPNFLHKYQEIQQKYQIPPELIEFELTETLVFENLELLKQVINNIHKIGFRCSMDDFGSGYSSLNVLRKVSVDVLKLDRGFFMHQNDARGNEIVKMVIQLAKKLGMHTVSEGVETNEQVEFLKAAGCDMVQGFVFSKPVPIPEFEDKAFHHE